MFTLEFWKATFIRAIRTFAESMLAYIGTGAIVLKDVDWLAALSAGGLGFVIAILMALATGIPEAPKTAPTNEIINDSFDDINPKLDNASLLLTNDLEYAISIAENNLEYSYDKIYGNVKLNIQSKVPDKLANY